MNIGVAYVRNRSRERKLLPLFEGISVTLLESWRDVVRLRRVPKNELVVLVDSFGRMGVLGLFASLFLHTPLIVRLRGEFFREERERVATKSHRLRWIGYAGSVLVARFCLWRAATIIHNSEYLASAMSKYTGRKPSHVVHNPYTELSHSNEGKTSVPLSEGLRLLTVTNMNLRSKIEPIFEALDEWIPAELWDELDLRWVLCGSGHYEPHLRSLVSKKALDDRVHILGKVDDVASLYDWCDVLIHLTRMDAFPNAPMEAMMSEKPVITNEDSCGVREQVFDGRNGFVIRDAGEFVASLRTYTKDKTLRDGHGLFGKELVESRFSVTVQRRKIHEILQEFMNTSQRRSGA